MPQGRCSLPRQQPQSIAKNLMQRLRASRYPSSGNLSRTIGPGSSSHGGASRYTAGASETSSGPSTVWPPLRAPNLFRMLRRYSVKHHREKRNQDRLSEKDSLKMGIGMHAGAASGSWRWIEAAVDVKNIDLAASIPMRSRRAETMRR